MPQPYIRHAGLADLRGILNLYTYLHPDEPTLEIAAAEAAWTALLASKTTIPFVAELDGVLASSCTLAIVPNMTRGARPYGVIENVVTHVSYRRIGLGRAILHAAVGHAWNANCYKVILATGSKKEATLRFYEAAGFRRGEKAYFEIRRS